jgi:hypothetical protein
LMGGKQPKQPGAFPSVPIMMKQLPQ